MYILPNGESISEDDIQSLADENDVSFYEIINEVGIKEFDDVDEEEYNFNPIKVAGNLVASVGSGFADLFSGGANLVEAVAEQGVLSYMNLSDQFTDDDFTDEDRAKYLQQVEDYVKVDESMDKVSSILGSLKTKHKYELFEDAVEDGQYLQALDMGLSDLGGSLPSFAASIYAGPAGIMALGLSEAGNSYEELSKASNEDRGLWMFGNAALQGTIEAGTELLFNKIFKGLSVVDTAGKILMQKSIGKTLSAASRIGAGAGSEALTENMAQEANNALDGAYMESKFLDKNGDVDYYSIKRRVLHTAVISGIMGGGGTSVQVRNDLITSALTPEAYSNKNVKHAENIIKLKATKKNISKNGASTLEIDQQIKNLEDAIDYNNKSVSEVVNSLSNEEKANQATLKKDIVDLEIQLKNSDLNDLSKQSIQQSIEAKKKQFNDLFNNKKKELQEQRENFDYLNSNKEAFDLFNEFSKLKNKDIYIEKASSELSLKGEELTDKLLNEKASEIYVNEKLSIKYDQLNSSAKRRAAKKYKGKVDILEINGDITEDSAEFKRVIEKVNDHYDNMKISEKEKNKLKEEAKNGLLNGTVDGFKIDAIEGYNDNKAIVVTAKQNGIKNGKIATLSHELLHLEMDQKFTDADQTVKGKKLLDYLSKNEKQLHARVIQRLNTSYAKRNEDGVLEKDSNYYLESLNALNDILAFNPDFKKNKTLITKVKEFINSVFGREVLKANDDVFSFVEAYSKSSNFNKNSRINKEAKEDDFTFIDDVYKEYDKETSTTKFSKTSVDEINSRFSSEDMSFYNSGTTVNLNKDDGLSLSEKIDLLSGDDKTKSEFQSQNGGFANVYNGILAGKFDQLFNTDLKNTEQKNLIKNNLSERLINYDPAKSSSLYAWMIGNPNKNIPGNIYFSKQDANKALATSNKNKSNSLNDDDSFLQISSDESETQSERKKQEATEKEVIVGQKGFQGETRKPLKDSITFENKETNSEFKLEVAKVLGTINIPITSQQQDFISKFREELTGRKYFKDSKGKTKQTVSLKDAWTLVRKESGWKNKSDYEAFLLKNKEALLNGLTTTYLSKAFPSAIEKFVVDGVDSNGNVTGNFTTSWNPKAKTGTKPGDIDFIRSVGDVSQLEGDKTGKQRMRRVSNVKQSVPDELWIDHFKTGKKSWPQMKSEPMWREIAGEMGYEVLQEEINKLDDYVESIEQITEDPGLNSDQVKNAIDDINNSDDFNIISKLYQNQESMNSFIIDSTVANINKQLERGVTKFSKSKELLEDVRNISNLEKQSISESYDIVLESGNYPQDILSQVEDLLPTKFGVTKFSNNDNITILSGFKGTNDQEKAIAATILKLLQSNTDLRITMKSSLSNTKGDFIFYDENGNILFAVEHKTKVSDLQGGHTINENGEVAMPRAQASAYIRKQLNTAGFIELNGGSKAMFTSPKKQGKQRQTWADLTKNQKISLLISFEGIKGKKEVEKKISIYRGKEPKGLTKIKNEILENKFKEDNKELIDYVKKVIQNPLVTLKSDWVKAYNKIAKSQRLQTIKSISDKNINKDIRRQVEKDKSLTKFVLIKDNGEGTPGKQTWITRTYKDQGTNYITHGPKAMLSSIDVNDKLGLNVTLRVVSSGSKIYARVFYTIPKQQLKEAQENINKSDSTILNLNVITDIANKYLDKPIKLSKSNENLSETFNKIIEQNENVDASKIFSDSTAKLDGATVGTYKFFVPPSAEDFMGLMYSFLGKGKVGDAQKNFFEETLNGPYKRGISKMESEKQRIEDSYKEARKRFPEITKKLGNKIPGTSYTYDQAIRVHLWKTGAFDQKVLDSIGLSNAEINMLNKTVTDDSRMQQFAREVGKSTGLPEGYIPPSDYWLVDTIASDLSRVVDKVGRKKFLNEFIENKKEIFDKDNLNKIEAVYGSNFREALEDILKRMETGTNRSEGSNRLVNRYTKWLNNSVGAIMFFNMRSATLQTISAANFMNWSDNNPLMAAKAFANQKQFWEDFVMIFNSDKLKQRRKGLKTDVNTAELANSVADSKDKAKAALNYLLKIGFAPTQLADSFAIAVGGASMYRNRVNTFKKQGMSIEEAQKAAFEDFAAIAEESQQSSDPSLVSQQQSGPLGRFILAFQNTPMQYNRLMKKAMRDLKNRRGDWKTNLSKIVYYGAVQNLIFSTLSNALFAMAFDDESEEEKQDKINKKEIRVVNNMIDTILRGSGVGGAAVATIKNGIMKYYEQENKKYGKDHAYTILELINYSPPIGKKLRNVYSAIKTAEWEKDIIVEKGFSLDSPIYKVGGSLTSAAFNIPLDRVVNKAHNVAAALDNNNSTIQRILLGLGWNTWDLNVKNEENELIKANAKDARRKAGYKKAAETRRNNNTNRTRQTRTRQTRTRK